MSETVTNSRPVRLVNPRPVPSGTGGPMVDRHSTALPSPNLVFETIGATAAKVIEIDRLWDATPGTTSQVVRALELLKRICDDLTLAKNTEDPLQADRLVQRVQTSLPKLFSLRSIGDGFGLIVNSVHFGLVNLRGTPLNDNQLDAVWRLFRELRNRPMIAVSDAIARAGELEESGLKVDPPDLDELMEGTPFAADE